MVAILVPLAVLTISTTASGTTLYVRSSGDDGNDGLSPTTAVASLGVAAERAVAPGDVVIAGPGHYIEGNIAPAGDGTATKPIELRGDPTGLATGDAPGPVLVDANRQFATGFGIFGRHNLIISGFYIMNAITAGIQVRGTDGGITPSGILIENNVIFSDGSGAVGRGIEVRNAEQVTIFNNLVYGNSSVGISAGGAAGSHGVHIINNTIYGHGYAGVVIGESKGAGCTGTWLISNIIAESGYASIDVNVLSRCDYVAAYNLITDPYSETTPQDGTDLLGFDLFPHAAGADGRLGGPGFADDDFSLPADSPAIDAGPYSATEFGLDNASTQSDGTPDSGRVDLGFHVGNVHYPGFSSVPIPQQKLYVMESGDDGNRGLTPANAFRTIQQAAYMASANTEIVVGPGLYDEGDITLGPLMLAGPVQFVADGTGELTRSAPGAVLVDAGGHSYGFAITGRCSVVIDGFAIRNTFVAAVALDTASNSTIRNNIIFSNAQHGIEVDDSNRVQVINNLIYANGTAGIRVGGLRGSRSPVLRSNTLSQNSWKDGSPAMAISQSAWSGARVDYNIFYENAAVVDNSQTLPDTNLVANPLFVAPSGPDGILGGNGFADDDFHLSQIGAGQAVTSAGVDQGPVTASSVGLDRRSTREDGVPDSGLLDWGFHYPSEAHSTVFVNPQGSDTNAGWAEDSPLRTLAEALQRASAGMQVRLAPGTYAESGLRPRAGVTIIGASAGPAQVDAGGASYGFDIRQRDVTINNVAITGAVSAGVRVQADDAQIIGCHVFSNPGKGIYVASGSGALLFNNTVSLNGSTGVVVGASGTAARTTSIVQNTIYKNNKYGITVGIGNPAPPPSDGAAIVNNVVAGNTVAGINIGTDSIAGLIISHNCNSNGYTGVTPPPTDIGQDPLLVTSSGTDAGADSSGDAAEELFLAQTDAGQGAESPCVDTGTGLLQDLGLEKTSTRTDGVPDTGAVDVGYHAGIWDGDTAKVRLTARGIGDCNGDSQVTIDEILLAVNVLLGNAPLTDCPSADGNADGAVTIDELLAALSRALG